MAGLVALVKQGAQVNDRSPATGASALAIAAAHCSMAALRLLLDHPKIRIDAEDVHGWTALMCASFPPAYHTPGLLAQPMPCPASRHAAAHGHDEAVVALLQAGAERSDRAVALAVERGCLTTSWILRADPVVHSLHEAARQGDTAVLEGLLRQHADVNLLDPSLPLNLATPVSRGCETGLG